ncbi:phosphoglycerate mutase family protein [Deinococcus radiophilus]|uniref:phosphoglycerate mutase family protein n=1 Tax=Deinococcus radiophilus TaxID=32062 RepID=UPI003618334B
MNIILVRHAQSANNLLYDETGSSEGRHADPPLTELGHTQAAALADFARTDATWQGVTHLYCSLTRRAVQTAAPLAAALGLGVQGLALAYEAGGLFQRDAEGVPQPVPGLTHAELLAESPALRWPPELPPAALGGRL